MEEQMIKVASVLSTNELMSEAKKMSASIEDYAWDVLNALLGALESRIDESAYIRFCDSL